MGPRSRSKSSRDKVRAHRQRLRKQGLRPIQIWVCAPPPLWQRLIGNLRLWPEVLMQRRIRTLSMRFLSTVKREARRDLDRTRRQGLFRKASPSGDPSR